MKKPLDLKKASMADIKENKKQFYFMDGKTRLPITRMTAEDYPTFDSIKKEDRKKFIESCRADWIFKTELLKRFLKEKNLFI